MRTIDVLIAEIGSTTTVVNAFNNVNKDPVFLGQGLAPTTVSDGDVTIGLKDAVKDLESNLGETISWNSMLATSSAAGGLKMTVHGLVYDMTVKAAKEAALGAGAVLHMVTAGELNPLDLERIQKIKPNIILLAGGVDYGDRNTVINNAYKLADIGIGCPVIYAGNSAAAEDVKEILEKNNIKVTVVDNVYPRIDELNIEPTRRVIQKVFEDHIIKAPGMDKIREMVTGHIIPTPGAVMNCAKLMKERIGDLLVIDVGGATTDVHSVTHGSEEINKLLVSPEPEAKRTVEGDLGIYINAFNIIKAIGEEKIIEELSKDSKEILKFISAIPKTVEEKNISEYLANKAAEIGVDRHAGEIKYLYGPSGRVTIAQGKDLTNVKWIIGTGGALTRLEKGRDVLSGLLKKNNPMKLFPKEDAKILIDKDYIMAPLGVLCLTNPEGAFRLMAKSLDLDVDNLGYKE
ncbi:MAG TPA: DNA mismatch repair protein MutL [Thermoanaerobacterales bacterium]|nr:DNA mismatch repair protein MutL [Thermoanaerobacterales bacterium]